MLDRMKFCHTITTRPYQLTDAQALASIYYNTIHAVNKADYTEEQRNAWAPESSLDAEDWKKKWEKLVPIVAICEGEVAGFAEFEDNGHIDCFYVHHEYQGRGVGSALMAAIDDQAKAQGIKLMFANVSITAKPFFERKGFSVVKEQQVKVRGCELTNFKMERVIEP